MVTRGDDSMSVEWDMLYHVIENACEESAWILVDSEECPVVLDSKTRGSRVIVATSEENMDTFIENIHSSEKLFAYSINTEDLIIILNQLHEEQSVGGACLLLDGSEAQDIKFMQAKGDA
jgi:hypothetical protein